MNIVDEWESWSVDELEKQMSPSRWNPNRIPETVVPEFIDKGVQETEFARKELFTELNIAYGKLPSQKLDLYGTDLGVNSPTFVFIHGGYWQEGSKDISAVMSVMLYKLGFRTAVVGYTLAPNAKIAQMQLETAEAIEFIISKYPTSKIVLGGHSAGAQLAAQFIHSSPKLLSQNFYDHLIGLFLISGVFDLRPLVNTYVNKPLKMSLKEAESFSHLINPIINPKIIPDQLSILIVVGEYDSPEFIRQSEDYYQKLVGTFPKTRFWKSSNDDHFTIVENMGISNTNCYNHVRDFLTGLKQ